MSYGVSEESKDCFSCSSLVTSACRNWLRSLSFARLFMHSLLNYRYYLSLYSFCTISALKSSTHCMLDFIEKVTWLSWGNEKLTLVGFCNIFAWCFVNCSIVYPNEETCSRSCLSSSLTASFSQISCHLAFTCDFFEGVGSCSLSVSSISGSSLAWLLTTSTS